MTHRDVALWQYTPPSSSPPSPHRLLSHLRVAVMAGRGADIRVQMLTTGEVHKLSVGLHTPLGIFKRQVRVCVSMLPPGILLLTVARRARSPSSSWRA
jgi:hypothetical protein